jgi:hypothetical protein
VAGGGVQNAMKLRPCLFQTTKFEKSPAQCHPGR